MSIMLETLASYVPNLIVRRLAANPAPLTAPHGERFPAAVLFADISGFTPLAERMAQRGPSGAEELTIILNAYFGQLIELVTTLGGDVIKFAGDAALALWPAGGENPEGSNGEQALATATLRAAQASLALQMILHNYEPTEDVRLSMRLGIGAGEILAASVGGQRGRWEFLVAGEPLVQMGIANKQAKPGDVVLSPEAWELVRDNCAGIAIPNKDRQVGKNSVRLEDVINPLPLRSPAPIKLAPEMETALKGYIPGAILTRLDAGQTGWLAELRHVTVVFLNLTGIDFEAPDALQQMQTVMHHLQTILYHYEGSVNQFIVDDKGTTLLAAFGLPPLTHEDDPLRGVQAAIEMQAELGRLGLRSAIGITSGRVFCGRRGSERRREYAMIGDNVNLSARLMVAAPDSILCDEATYHTACSRLGFETLPHMTVKGKKDPIAVYRPLSPAEAAAKHTTQPKTTAVDHKSTIVGRAKERAMLEAKLQTLLKDSQGGTIVIEGEAGIGKSRLVSDLLERAKGLGIPTLSGAGDAIEKSTPYHAWRPVFRQFFSLDTLTDADERRKRVLERLQAYPNLMRLAPLLNAVLPLDLPENDITRQMDGQVRADNTRTLLLQLLQTATAQSPTLLVLEDAHWMDSASWLLTLFIGQGSHSLLLVIVARPLLGALPEEYCQMLFSADNAQWLNLEALSLEDTLALVRQQLGVKSLPEAVAALIRDKAQGNPFFSEEMAYALRDSGLILIDEGECHIATGAGNLNELSLPDTVQGIITSRIDRLPPSQQLALKVASVIGRAFAFRILRDIYPLEADKEHLGDYLDVLRQLDLTPLDPSQPDLGYTFKHIITQEVAYNLMLFSQRQQLHRAVAEWYERTYADDLSSSYPLLAHHWSKAQVPAKAIAYLEKAGEQALHSYANREAVNFFSQALELVGPQLADQSAGALSEQRARWERQLGEAYLGLGQLRESRQHLEQALMLLGQAAPSSRQGLVLSLGDQVVRQIVHRAWLARFARSPQASEEKTRAAIVSMEAARAYWVLGQVYFYANEATLNINANLRSLNLAEAAGPSPELALSHANVSVAAGLIPLHPIARAYSRRAREIARSVNHLPSLAWVLLLTAVYDAGSGQWEEAQKSLKEAIEISAQLGDRRRWEQGMNTLATITYLQGNFAKSARLFADLYTSARERGDVQYRAYGVLGQIRCMLSLGQVGAATVPLAELDFLLAEHLGRLEEVHAHGLMALAYSYQEELDLAGRAAETALDLISQSRPISYTLLLAYSHVAQVCLNLWASAEPEAAASNFKSRAKQACRALGQFARVFPIGQPSAWLWQGLYEQISGRPHRAQALWGKCLETAGRLGMPYEQGLAHYELAQHTSGAKGQEHLARAGQVFKQLNAGYDLRRAGIEMPVLQHRDGLA
ncbi:MAG: AAA family ATPase [Thermoflexales bacterium]|nr:AAA family ATPase [Thermoflexales bacterium]